MYILCIDQYFERGTGALAIIVANPTDLVKVRLQTEGQMPTGVPRRYSGAMDAYVTIVRLVRQSSNLFVFVPFLF